MEHILPDYVLADAGEGEEKEEEERKEEKGIGFKDDAQIAEDSSKKYTLSTIVCMDQQLPSSLPPRDHLKGMGVRRGVRRGVSGKAVR